MRIAVISDIHGNLPALEATLEHLEGEDLDEIVVAGDLVNGASDSRACWQLIRSRGYPLLRGNHERYLFDLGTPNERPEWRTERFEPVRWAKRQFSAEELDEMAALPLCFSHPAFPGLLVVHAAPSSDRLNIRADTANEVVEELFVGTSATLIARGHDHVGAIRSIGERLVATAGSVGMPLDGDPAAKFLTVELRADGWKVQHHAVPYDFDETLHRAKTSGYLEEAGPMAGLMLREITSGQPQMTPFLRRWLEIAPPQRPPFGQAVREYLKAS